MKLSIIIPVFNEEKTVAQVLKKVISVTIPGIKKEVIIVNDGSSDRTREVINSFLKKSGRKDVFFLEHKKNIGKGAAVKTGIGKASGEYIVIQDADVEYDPNDLKRLFEPIKKGEADIVYGTRLNRLPNLKKEERRSLFLMHYFGNRFLSLITSILYGKWITDMETCYKIFPKKAAVSFNLKSKGFEFEPEITAKLLRQNLRFKEMPISTSPRGHDEGKKLNTFRDGPIALWTLVKYKIINT